MSNIKRRRFLQLLGASAAATFALPGTRAWAAAPRVVVIGAGFAGATVAKYLRHWGGTAVDVTLVERNPSHIACILSNLVLTNALTLSKITIPYTDLAQKYGVKLVQASALGIDPVNRTVSLSNGAKLPYDRLVLSPGIDFLPQPGLDFTKVPHAWQAGAQTTLLKNQISAMPRRGGTFVLSIPKAPYRCPPGPYERACVVADYLKRKKPGSKVIVLDANPQIMAEAHTFTTAFTQIHAGVIEYHPNVPVTEVDSANRVAITPFGNVKGNVLNVLPPMKAGPIAFTAGTVNDASGRWAGVNPLSYESTAVPGVHVIGDSQATGQPKSGHMANAQAKVCADAILRYFNGGPPDPTPTTASACFSPITASSAGWLTVVFAYDPNTGTMKSVPASFAESPSINGDNYEMMFRWAGNLFADSFA